MNLTNVKRWIKASIINYIKTERLNYYGEKEIYLFVEGEDKRKTEERFELRIDGPYSKPCGSAGEYRHYIEVNILVNTTRNEENIYNMDNLQGLASEILNRDFCVYKTGNVGKNDADDGSYFGTMQLMPTEQIKLSDFGRVDPDTELYQAVAEAHYEMYTKE